MTVEGTTSGINKAVNIGLHIREHTRCRHDAGHTDTGDVLADQISGPEYGDKVSILSARPWSSQGDWEGTR
jgi:hypothetical protein